MIRYDTRREGRREESESESERTIKVLATERVESWKQAQQRMRADCTKENLYAFNAV